MKNFVRSLTALAVVLSLMGAGAVSAQAATSPQDDVAVSVNQQRASAGLGALRRDATLDAAAQEWAKSMSDRNSMTHSTSEWRAARIPAGWTSNGENIAYGYRSADAVMSAWMNSAGHRANILRKEYTRIGVGYVATGNYWVQIFAGYPNDQSAAPTFAVPGAIGTLWRSIGGAASEVGNPVGDAVQYSVNGGGWAQEFEKGYIYVSAAGGSGALRKNSAIFADYASTGSQYGRFGWPLFSERCTADSCVVGFTNGAIGWTAAGGVQRVEGANFRVYAEQDYDRGPLGAPRSGVVQSSANGGGSTQTFTGGVIYSTATATSFLRNSSGMYQRYLSERAENGALGWPLGSESCAGNACSIQFQNGVLGWTPSTGIRRVTAEMLTAYRSAGGPSGPLGVPVTDVTRAGDRLSQEYAGGYTYSTPSASSYLRKNSGIVQRYLQSGGTSGSFGWPAGSEQCGTASCFVEFDSGMIAWTTTSGIHAVQGSFRAAYRAEGGTGGAFGLPTSGAGTYSGGRAQNFQGGYFYQKDGTATAVGLRMNSAIFQRFAQLGSQNGRLGWPLTGETCSRTACSVEFERGIIGWTPGSGVNLVEGPLLAPYRSAGGPLGTAGVPVGGAVNYTSNGGGTAQDLQNAYIYSSSGGSSLLAKSSPILKRYAELGSQYGRLGWPISSEARSGNTGTVLFQRGRIDVDYATGVVTVSP